MGSHQGPVRRARVRQVEVGHAQRMPAIGVALLRDALSRAIGGKRVALIDTRMSQVLLAGDWAIKLRRPRAPTASAAERQRALVRELRCNRRLSPRVYVGVLPVCAAVDRQPWLAGLSQPTRVDRTGSASRSVGQRIASLEPIRLAPFAIARSSGAGSVNRAVEREVSPEGRPIDWALLMRRLPARRFLDRMIRSGEVRTNDIDRLASRLYGLYRESPLAPCSVDQHRARFEREQAACRTQLLALGGRLAAGEPEAIDRLERLLDDADVALRDQRDALAERIRARCVIEAHGDLRPEHVCLIEPIELIDRLDFDRRLRWLDPWEELCLLGLLCAMAGAAWIGPRLARGLLIDGARHPMPARELLAFYSLHHALVRARLALSHLSDPRAPRARHWLTQTRRYLGHAEAAGEGWQPLDPQPMLRPSRQGGW